MRVKSSGMARGLANARTPGSAKFANAPPLGLTRPRSSRGGGLGAGGIDWCIKPFSIANYWALLHIFSPILLHNFHLPPFSLHTPLRPSILTRSIYEKHHQKKYLPSCQKLFFGGSNSYLNRFISMTAVLFVSNIKLPVCNKSVTLDSTLQMTYKYDDKTSRF